MKVVKPMKKLISVLRIMAAIIVVFYMIVLLTAWI